MDIDNLLEQTILDIKNSGHTTSDVLFVGSEDGLLQLDWQHAQSVLDVTYDSGFGAAEIASDLCVMFRDGGRLIRHEYDGSEWWRYVPPAAEHGVPFKIIKTESYRSLLGELNYPMGLPEQEERP